MNATTERMLTAAQTMEMVGCRSINTIRRLMDEEGFPRPYQIMQGRNSWDEHEVATWLKRRKTELRSGGSK